MPLPRAFFARPTLEVARELLGCLVISTASGERRVGRLVEVEAYIGRDDTACHAAKGRTPRTEVMFGPPGHAYLYFTYGMHWLLNAVTEAEGVPCAVLLRAAEVVEGEAALRAAWPKVRPVELLSGPARLTRGLGLGGAQNRHDLTKGQTLWLEPGEAIPEARLLRSPRVGIDYAAPKDRLAPWRLSVIDSGAVSRRRAGG